MPIDAEVFKREWAALCQRFQRDASRLEAARYYRHLDARLDTGEFLQAAAVIYDRERWLPPPVGFVEAVRGSADERAAAEWDLCLSVMRGSSAALDRMTDAGRSVVALLGGADALRRTLVADIQWVRKEWTRLYPHAMEIQRREAGALPGWTADDSARVRNLPGAPSRLLGGRADGEAGAA